MKYAILFAFAAFAFLAQVNAKTIVEAEDTVNRGAIANALKAKLEAAKKKLDEMLDVAQNALKEKMNEVKEAAEQLIEKLKQKANEINDQVFEAAHEVLDKVDKEVNASLPINTRSHGIEGISECMIMKDTIRLAALAIIANTSSCLNDKFEEGEQYVVDIIALYVQASEEIKEIKAEGDECMKHIDGISEITTAIGCIATVTGKATVVVGKTIPAVTLNAGKLVGELALLVPTLSICMPKNALVSLSEQAMPVIVSIKDCIQEKLTETQTESSEEEEYPEEYAEVESHNEVVDKYPQVDDGEVQTKFGEGHSYTTEHQGLIEVQD